MKTGLNIFFLILGVLFAYLQLNDPDPMYWVPCYVVLSILAGLALIGKPSPKLAWAATLIYTILLSTYIPELIGWIKDGMPSVVESMKASTPYVEYVREGGGLLICALIAFYYTKQK